MELLSKGAIVGVQDLKTEAVDVPEWGGAVSVRTMTGADRDAFENSLVTIAADGTRKPDMVNMRAKLVALTLVDEAGAPMFTLKELDLLAAKSAAALDRIFQVAQRLNGLGLAGVEAAEKN